MSIAPKSYTLEASNSTLAFERLLNIMGMLREHCPWDKKQNLESLRYLTIEETYELSDAILEKDWEEVKKELGDLLLHIVFYAKIGQEEAKFDITDVCNGICNKLVNRHPHIFSEVIVNSAEDVKQNWEKIKLKEGDRKSVLGGVPKSLPAMVKAYRIQEKVRGVGFDWENADQVWEKVREEVDEFKTELNAPCQDKVKLESEFGDILFALINYARFIDINPEDALERTNKKFISRFNYLEKETIAKGKDLHKMSLDEMNIYWEKAKENESL